MNFRSSLMTKGISNTIIVARMALLSALSGVGAFIPIPSPVGSIALDSAPGYFAALAYGALDGAGVCAIGHLLSAARAGYPLGTVHLLVALLMAVVGVAVATVSRRFGMIPGIVTGIAVNTAGAPLAVPVFGWGVLPILVPLLAVASSVNAVLAGLAFKATRKLGGP